MLLMGVFVYQENLFNARSIDPWVFGVTYTGIILLMLALAFWFQRKDEPK
jgi:protein-S-isoprenylcysteine O-methyltransferase Ste14